jgi:hypothetical protein
VTERLNLGSQLSTISKERFSHVQDKSVALDRLVALIWDDHQWHTCLAMQAMYISFDRYYCQFCFHRSFLSQFSRVLASQVIAR